MSLIWSSFVDSHCFFFHFLNLTIRICYAKRTKITAQHLFKLRTVGTAYLEASQIAHLFFDPLYNINNVTEMYNIDKT